nr:retrovirus-related Pol polyprotein from transposon TNT 1-94 [Tanacetum cinerariifolium]
MVIVEDESSVGKASIRLGQWVNITMKKVYRILSMTDDQLLSEQKPRNIVKALGRKGKRKEKISSKEAVFTKANESSSMLTPEITSDSESECDSQKPLPPHPKLIGAAPSGTSESLISLSNLTLNMVDLTLDTLVPKKTIPSVKVSPVYVIKKKKEKYPTIPKPCFDKNIDSSTEQLFLTQMEEVKGLKRYIEIPSGTPPSSSQPSSFKATKQKTWFGPYKHCRFKNHLSDDCYSNLKCFTCGSSDHLTKEHLEHATAKKTLREAVNTACYTQNRSIIVNRHRKTSYDVFRGRSPDISYFHVFECPVHIHNHRDHLGKFDEKADDGFFLGYSLVAKSFRVFNIRRQKMKETVHVTFSEDDEAISQSSTKCDAINFNENRSFPNDEFFKPRSEVTYITTRSRIRDSDAPSASKCLYVNFFFEMEPKKLIEALEEERWIIAMQEELNQFERNKLADPISNSPHVYMLGSGFDLKAYSDSDYAGSEAECLVATGCCAQVLWIKSHLADYDVLYDKVPIFCDNTSVISISNNPVLHSRTKHIDIRYHLITDHILKDDIKLYFVPTDSQLADIFTKPLAEPSFTRLVAELVYVECLKEFWYTTEVEEETKTNTFLLSWWDKPMFFSQDEFISAIGLPTCKNVVPLPPKETVILPKKQVAETQYAEVTVATTDATKSLVASELAEDQVNQPLAAKAEKVINKNIMEEEDAMVHSIKEPNFEQLMDEVDKLKEGSQRSILDDNVIDITHKYDEERDVSDFDLRSMPSDDLSSLTGFEAPSSVTKEHFADNLNATSYSDVALPYAFACVSALFDPLGHLQRELTTISSKIDQLESQVTKCIFDELKSSVPSLVTNTLKEQLPGLLLDALKDTFPHLIKDSIKISILRSIIDELPLVEAQEEQSVAKENTKTAMVTHKSKEKKSEGVLSVEDDSNEDDLDKQPLLKIFKIMTHIQDIQNPIHMNTFIPKHLLKPEKQQKSIQEFTDQLFGTTSSKFSPTPPKEPTPPKDSAKGKEVAIIEEQVNKLVLYQEDGGSNPKMPKRESFITLEGPLSQETFNAQLKEIKRLVDLKDKKEKSKQELRKMFDDIK